MTRKISGDRRSVYRSAPWMSGHDQGALRTEARDRNGSAGLHPSAAQLLHTLPQAALVLNESHRVAGVNARFIALAGVTTDTSLIGKSPEELAQHAALFRDATLTRLLEGVAADNLTPTTVAIPTPGAEALTARLSPLADGGVLLTLDEPGTGNSTGKHHRIAFEIVENVPGVVFRRVRHRDGTVTCPYVSAGARQLFDRPAIEFTDEGVDPFDCIHPEDRDRLEAVLQSRMQDPGTFDEEVRIVRKDGETFQAHYRGRVFADSDGALVIDARMTNSQARIKAENASRRVQVLLDSAIDNIPHVVSVRDAGDFSHVLMNRAGEKLFQRPREYFIGKTDNDVFDPEQSRRRRERDRLVVETARPVDFPEFTLNTEHLGRRLLKTRKIPLFDETGAVEYILSLTEDVTEQRKAEAALKKSGEKLRDIAESASDWFWETDAEGRFTEITGFSQQVEQPDVTVAIGTTREKNAWPADVAEESEKWAEHREDIAQRRPLRNFVYRFKGGENMYFYARVNGRPVFDADGTFKGYRGSATDITVEIEAVARAARAQKRLMEAIENISDGIALFNADDRLVLYNKQYTKMWPGTQDVIRPGAQYADLVRAVAEKRAVIQGASMDTESYVAERVASHRNPPERREHHFADGRWVQSIHAATSDGGIVIACTDITALKEREERLRRSGFEAVRAKEAAEIANRSKSEFLANMSHELRTPLNAVIGFSDIIKSGMMGTVNETYRGYAKDIHNSGNHLLELINDILDMSKIEAGKLDLTDEEMDVATAIEASIVLVRERAEKSGLTLVVSVADDLPRLRADIRKTKQILINLLSNAVKFTPDGGKITVEAFVDPSGEFVLRVSDTGIGIKREDIDKVMAPFGQVETGLTRSYEGTGLGLTLTQGLLEQHGGRLEIVSKAGEGTTGTLVSAIFPADRVIRA